MKRIIVLLFFGIIGLSAVAQENPFRVGIKLGIPYTLCASGEWVSPIMGGRVAFFLDATYLPIKADDVTVKAKFVGVGTHFYFGEDGKGLYVGLGTANLWANVEVRNLTAEEVPATTGGVGTIIAGLTNIHVKVGAKIGDKFYFRPEIGYGFQSMVDDVVWEVNYPNGYSEVRVDEVPEIFNYGIIANVGIGMSF